MVDRLHFLPSKTESQKAIERWCDFRIRDSWDIWGILNLWLCIMFIAVLGNLSNFSNFHLIVAYASWKMANG